MFVYLVRLQVGSRAGLPLEAALWLEEVHAGLLGGRLAPPAHGLLTLLLLCLSIAAIVDAILCGCHRRRSHRQEHSARVPDLCAHLLLRPVCVLLTDRVLCSVVASARL
jgi:hypothetical protein